MNSFTAVDVFYLRSNRTIETILLRNKRMQKMLFVYNYQGLTYRIFETEVN